MYRQRYAKPEPNRCDTSPLPLVYCKRLGYGNLVSSRDSPASKLSPETFDMVTYVEMQSQIT